ncbi:MAG: DUF192 domain-containing protein [Limisphaerales bacterium]
MNLKQIVFTFLSAALLVGCNRQEPQKSTPPPPAVEQKETGVPQPRLQTLRLFIGGQEMITEIAWRPHEVQTGMMFRTNMAENEGMLFVFSGPHRTSFWMKNTQVPLSAAYINPQGVIEEIHKLEPHNTNSVVASSDNIQFVLETPQGWFERHNIPTGSVVRTERGSLQETFFQRR